MNETDDPDVLAIIGASARAAASSALRAGLRPWCADLFADVDLQALCPASRLVSAEYPAPRSQTPVWERGLWQILKQAPPGPWMYTGALENRPTLVRQLALLRPLWGNNADVLSIVRSPIAVRDILRAAGLPCPEVRLHSSVLRSGRWLAKPMRGAGGVGIHEWSSQSGPKSGRKGIYFQEFVEGASCAAVYLGDGVRARVLGATRQMIGEDFLHAAPFHYCGTIGPMLLTAPLQNALQRLGDVLVKASGLGGIFGVDFILRDQDPWPVEVNPRYTASIEVLEHALRASFLDLHHRICVARPESSQGVAGRQNTPCEDSGRATQRGFIGKAILFAKADLTFPAEGPWLETIQRSPSVNQLPDFADIPAAGEHIATGRPVLTFFTEADSPAGCRRRLEQTARDLDQVLCQS